MRVIPLFRYSLFRLLQTPAFPDPSDDPYVWCGALLNGAVVSLGMTVCGCTALWC